MQPQQKLETDMRYSHGGQSVEGTVEDHQSVSDSISYHARNKTVLATQGLLGMYRTGNTSLVILFPNFCLKLYTIKLRFGFHLLSNSNFLFGGTLLESSVANISNIFGFLVQTVKYINYSTVSCPELLEYSFIL